MKAKVTAQLCRITPFLAFLLTLLFVFSKPLFTEETLYSFDAAPFYQKSSSKLLWGSYSGTWDNGMLGTARNVLFTPSRLLAHVLPDFSYHTARYLLNTLFTFLALIVYLRVRGFKGFETTLPAFAFSLSGYYFSLISAGHIFIFDMMPYVILLMTCIELGMLKGSLFYYALAGALIGLGLSGGVPDMMALFLILIISQALFRFVQIRPRSNLGNSLAKRVMRGWVALLFCGLTSFQVYTWLSDGVLEARQQLQGTGSASKWDYATNWSFPPKETVEFIAPCIFGTYSLDPERPYWGSIGRPKKWDNALKNTTEQLQHTVSPDVQNTAKQRLSMLYQTRNFRQHTVYLGIIPIVFSLYAMVWAAGRREEEADRPRQREVWFWVISALVALLLSFGHYFPLYKFFFQLPLFNQIRGADQVPASGRVVSGNPLCLWALCVYDPSAEPREHIPKVLATDPVSVHRYWFDSDRAVCLRDHSGLESVEMDRTLGADRPRRLCPTVDSIPSWRPDARRDRLPRLRHRPGSLSPLAKCSAPGRCAVTLAGHGLGSWERK